MLLCIFMTAHVFPRNLHVCLRTLMTWCSIFLSKQEMLPRIFSSHFCLFPNTLEASDWLRCGGPSPPLIMSSFSRRFIWGFSFYCIYPSTDNVSDIYCTIKFRVFVNLFQAHLLGGWENGRKTEAGKQTNWIILVYFAKSKTTKHRRQNERIKTASKNVGPLMALLLMMFVHQGPLHSPAVAPRHELRIAVNYQLSVRLSSPEM